LPAVIMPENEFEKKRVVITDRCFEMLDEAMNYLIDHYAPGQAEIMNSQFFAAAKFSVFIKVFA